MAGYTGTVYIPTFVNNFCMFGITLDHIKLEYNYSSNCIIATANVS